MQTKLYQETRISQQGIHFMFPIHTKEGHTQLSTNDTVIRRLELFYQYLGNMNNFI